MKIIVACGGTSGEREVSLRSGAAVAEALNLAGIEAVCEDVTSIRAFLERWDAFKADGVFIALHGGWGEDGRFQAALEAWGIPYTGSGPMGCLLAMDKGVSRTLFHQAGIPIAPGLTLAKGDRAFNPGAWLRDWGKVVIKPCCGGSTIGITIAQTPSDIERGLALAWEMDSRVVVEKFIEGTELTVAVCEMDSGLTAWPVIEMRPISGFYDYESKYTRGSTEYICPAPLSAAVTSELQRLAVLAHSTLSCDVYSRVDFRLTPQGEPFILEVNTAPGMTGTSLVPKAALAAGLSFGELLLHLIKISKGLKRG